MRGLRTDDGSTLVLTLGYALLAACVIFVCVCATDLHLAQKRLDSLADAASAAASEHHSLVIEQGVVRVYLDDQMVRLGAEELLRSAAADATLVRAESPDGTTAHVTLARRWLPPLFSPFVPDGVRLEATSRSRAALR